MMKPGTQRPLPTGDGAGPEDRANGTIPVTLGRYRIGHVLGRGGTGLVYEAYDTKNDSVVALKTIGGDALKLGENLYRLKHEFRGLADLQHRNLVRFGELSCDAGQWFFTMELVRGCDFLEFVRPGNESPRSLGPLDTTRVESPGAATSGVTASARTGRRSWKPLHEARLRSALAQVVAALSAVHAAGHVHRDVKPSNVLVTNEGRVVVLDFGLITRLKGATGPSEEGMQGTPAFMAPEQAEEGAVGPAADWYALGVMLFVALTGALPFEGTAHEIVTAKMTLRAPSPLDLEPEAPADLAALCADLLRMTPAERPKLDEIRTRLKLVDDSANVVAAEPASPFVGRAVELRALEAAYQDVARGRARAVILEGEPGIGKSSLVQHFLDSLGEGALTFSGRSYEQESVPFKGIDTIVDALSEHLLGRIDVDDLLRGGVRYLATVFPVLNRVPLVFAATANARKIDNSLMLREQAFGELERLFAALSCTRSVVLYMDDLQWADRDSLALLRRVLGAAPLLFVATMRSGAELHAEARELLATAERIQLHGLSQSESRMLCGELKRSGGAALSPSEEALIFEAAGHPLFLGELLRSSRREPLASDVHTKLQDVLWSRIQERDPLERRFLGMLAVAGAPTPYEAIARAAEIDIGECQTRLGALRAAQLVRVTRRGDERLVEPYHDRVRESILLHRPDAADSPPPPRGTRAADHLRLGRALLQGTPPEGMPARLFAIVQHLNAGRALIEERAERVRLAALNLAASREAHLTTAYESARAHAVTGLELLGAAGWGDAYALTRDLLAAEFLAGDVEAAEGSFKAARARMASHSDRTNLYTVWIELEANRGHFDRAIAAGRERLEEIGMAPPARITTVTLLAQYAATRRGQAGRPIDALVSLEPSRDEVRESAMRILMTIIPAAFWVDANLVGWISLKIADLSMRYGVSDVSSFGFASYGVVLAGAFGKYREAAAFGRLALALNERFRNEGLAARLLQLNGEFLVGWVQPFAEAKKLLQASYERALKEGETAYEAFAACSLSHVSWLEGGPLEQSQATSAWARDVCTRRRDWNMAGSVEAHARYCATLRGERPLAPTRERVVDAEFRALAGDASKAPGAYYAFWSCHAWLAYLFGDASGAEALLLEARKLAQANFGNPGAVDFCFLEALVAARTHDAAPWPRRFVLRQRIARRMRKLREWAEGCPANFEPHYLIARAELARVSGDAPQAVAAFEQAVGSVRSHGGGVREGLALELASKFYAERGDESAVERLRKEAAEAYLRCGATAKGEALSKVHLG